MDLPTLKITFTQVSPYLFTLSLTLALGILLAKTQSLKKSDKSFTLVKKITYFLINALWIFTSLMALTLILVGIII